MIWIPIVAVVAGLSVIVVAGGKKPLRRLVKIKTVLLSLDRRNLLENYLMALTRLLEIFGRYTPTPATTVAELERVCERWSLETGFVIRCADWQLDVPYDRRKKDFLCCDANCVNCVLWPAIEETDKESLDYRRAYWYWAAYQAMRGKSFGAGVAELEALVADLESRLIFKPAIDEQAQIDRLIEEEGTRVRGYSNKLWDELQDERRWAAMELGIPFEPI